MARKPRLIRGQDYLIEEDGGWEFTRDYLERLGMCCKNKCRHCPYKPDQAASDSSDALRCSSPSSLAAGPGTRSNIIGQ